MSQWAKLVKVVGIVVLVTVAVLVVIKQRGLHEQRGDTTRHFTEVLADLTPKGWKIYNHVLQFTPGNLYKQINGRAEFYLAYDVIGMTFTTFESRADKEQFIDLSIYDMGTLADAFGVYSNELTEAIIPLHFGRASYRSGANYYIWKGQYYVQIIASDTTKNLRKIGMDLAQKVTDALTDSGEPVWGLRTLPQMDRTPGSVKYFKVDALGLDFMGNTYTARYSIGDSEVSVFLSLREFAETAQQVVEQYVEYANRYGKNVSHLTEDGVEFTICDMGGTYDVIFQKGSIVGGVITVKNRDLALRAARDFRRQLRHS